MTVREVMSLPLAQRLDEYTGSRNITSFSLDDQTYTGYKGYSFFWELTLVSEPERSSSGSMDLSSNAYFITPHLRIDFSLISYPDYQRLRQQMLSKLTFMLSCYDTDFGVDIQEEVYFHPDTLPNFKMIARKLNGEKWTEILGRSDYTVELVGTNRTVGKINVNYNLNVPSGVIWSYPQTITKEYAKNATFGMGTSALFQTGVNSNYDPTYTKASAITFGDKYIFKKWSKTQTETANSTTFVDGDEYFLTQSLTVYAIWEKKQ